MADPSRAGRDYYDLGNAQAPIIKPKGPVNVTVNNYGTGPGALKPPPPVPEAQIEALLNIVANIPAGVAAALRKACSDSLVPPAQLTILDDAPSLIDDMVQRPITRQWPPLFECVERFTHAAGLAADSAQALREWIDSCANVMTPPVSPKIIDRMRRDVTYEMNASDQADNFSWLQVYLEPDSSNRTLERKLKLFRHPCWTPYFVKRQRLI
jgi:hypothetical protein